MIKLSIVIPVYNEQQSISSTMEQIKEAISKINVASEIIVVDDYSKDRTNEILNEIEGIKVIRHKENKGYSAALKTGIKNSQGEWIGITDADGTYPIEDFSRLWEYTKEYDMVVGARTGKHVAIPFVRKPAKWFINKVANYIAGKRIPDLNSGLRIFKKEVALRFWSLYPEGFSFTSTITLACMTNGIDVKYIPINYYKREGKSLMKPKHFIMFCNLLIRITTYFRPLKIFIPIALIFLALGITKGAIDFMRDGQLGLLAVMVIIAAIQIGFMGLIAELIIKRTNL